jgi:oligoendopeptidase F
VFGEMLTFRKLLERRDRPGQRKALLAGKVEDMINTVVRQIAFYDFERKLHEARREGELTSDADRRDLDERCRPKASGPSFEFMPTATRPSGPTSRTSSTRRSTSTPTRSATGW